MEHVGHFELTHMFHLSRGTPLDAYVRSREIKILASIKILVICRGFFPIRRNGQEIKSVSNSIPLKSVAHFGNEFVRGWL
jgi:hypothetical protein